MYLTYQTHQICNLSVVTRKDLCLIALATSLTTRHAPCSVTVPALSWFRIPDMYQQGTPALQLAQGLSAQDCLYCYVNVSSGLSRGSPTGVIVAAHAGAGYWSNWTTCMRTSNQISFSFAISPVNINYQSNRRTKHFPLLQSLIMNSCIIHFSATKSKVITFSQIINIILNIILSYQTA